MVNGKIASIRMNKKNKQKTEISSRKDKFWEHYMIVTIVLFLKKTTYTSLCSEQIRIIVEFTTPKEKKTPDRQAKLRNLKKKCHMTTGNP